MCSFSLNILVYYLINVDYNKLDKFHVNDAWKLVFVLIFPLQFFKVLSNKILHLYLHCNFKNFNFFFAFRYFFIDNLILLWNWTGWTNIFGRLILFWLYFCTHTSYPQRYWAYIYCKNSHARVAQCSLYM